MADSASRQGSRTIPILGSAALKFTKRNILFSTLAASICLLGIGAIAFTSRYKASDEMPINLKELSNTEYPANPAALGANFQRYSSRKLTVIKRDDTRFDFVLEPTNEKTAKIVIKNIDVNLLVPKVPAWAKQDKGLEVIALTYREWNRQQITFPADSEHIEITGGDGFEKQNLHEIALANNCLNAGYWEILLFTKEKDNKSLYYQGWFTFPMGQYKNLIEKINDFSYWEHGWKLEHWQDPSGTAINLNSLRKVIDEKEVAAKFPLDEKIISTGEQSRKIRTTLTTNLTTWGDFYNGKNEVNFASFIPPGFYDNRKPWGSQYWKIGGFKKAILRNTQPVGSGQNLQEIELVFRDTKTDEQNRLLFSGIDLKKLPKLPVEKYDKGLYMPMGIAVPPFNQSYEDLKKNHPYKSPYFSGLLDAKGKWIDQHRLGLAGVAMHLDRDKPNLLHLYLLSYERVTLVGHFTINLDE